MRKTDQNTEYSGDEGIIVLCDQCLDDVRWNGDEDEIALVSRHSLAQPTDDPCALCGAAG